MKRLLSFLFAFIVFPVGAFAVPAIRQCLPLTEADTAFTTTLSASFSGTCYNPNTAMSMVCLQPTVGNFMVVGSAFFVNFQAGPQFISDNQSNFYQSDQQVKIGGGLAFIDASSAAITTSTGTFTVTMNVTQDNASGSSNSSFVACEVSGLANAVSFDSAGNNEVTGTSMTVTSTAANSNANDIIFAVQGVSNVPTSPPTGYTSALSAAPVLNQWSFYFKVVSAIQTPSITYAFGSSNDNGGLIVSYKGSQGVGICTGSSPSLIASTWAAVQICHNRASTGDTITVAHGSYAASTKISITKFVKIVPDNTSGGVTITDNTCPSLCPGGDHTANMIDFTGSSNGATQFGNMVGKTAAGFIINQGTAIHGNPNAVIHIQDPGPPAFPVVIIGNSYTATAGRGDYVAGEGDTGVLAYNTVTGTISPGSGCLNSVSMFRGNGTTAEWTSVSKFGSADTNGNSNWYLENNTILTAFESGDGNAGARIVDRFNTFSDSGLVWHGADSEQVGTRHVEVYNNSFTHSATNTCGDGTDANQQVFIGSRGGSLRLFNNRLPTLNTICCGPRPGLEQVVWGIWLQNGVEWSCWGTPQNAMLLHGRPFPYQEGWGFITGATQAGNSTVFMDLEQEYFGGNSGADGTVGNYDNGGVTQGGQPNDCASTEDATTYIQNNREMYVQTAVFDGTSGTGTGPRSSRPATCTLGVGWWATDQGTWNTSGSAGPGTNVQGVLDKCTGTNTWTNAFYVPFTYPHPLVNAITGSAFTITQQPGNIVSGQTFSPPIAGTISTGAVGDSIVLSSVSGTCTPTGTLTVLTTSGGAWVFTGVGATGPNQTGCIWKVTDNTNLAIPALNLNAFNLAGTMSFTQQPTNLVSGGTFSPTIVITLTSTSVNSITLSSSVGTCNPTGTVTVNSTGGSTNTATFTGVGANGAPQANCQWLAVNNTDSTVPNVLSAPFNMTGTMGFTTQPVNTQSGSTMSTFAVTTSDLTFAGLITLTPSCTGGAMFTNLTATASSGVASFTTTATSGFGNCNFVASAPNHSNVTSNNFLVFGTLSFVNGPTNTISGNPISGFVLASSDGLLTGSVTLTANGCGAGFTNLTQTASGGNVAYNTVGTSATGSNCNFTAHPSPYNSVTSGNFNVVAALPSHRAVRILK